MSREDGFHFTQLVEEDDDLADIREPYLDLELQPHLSTFNSSKGIRNTIFETDDDHTSQVTKWQPSHFQGIEKPTVQLGKEAHSEQQKEDNPIAETVSNIRSNAANTNTSAKSDLEFYEHYNGDNNANGVTNPFQEQTMVHIQYSSTEGKVNVLQGQVVRRSDGSRYINTKGIPQHWSESERPLRQRKIRFLKIFSFLSCIAFFPFGILAVYFAFRTETEFTEGIMKGNIDRAQKFARRTKKLIIASFIMFIVIVILVVIIVVRKKNHRSVTGGPIMG